MDGDVAGLGAAVVAAATAVYYYFKSQQAAAVKITEAWDDAARKLHGSAVGGNGAYGERTLRASVDGKVLLIVADTRKNNRGGDASYVRVRAGTLLNLAPLEIEVGKRGLLGKIAQSLHVAEIETSDATFQEEFRVTGHPAALARAFLDRMTREHIRDLGEPFALAGREFLLERDGYPETSEALVTMARYAEVMVSRWNRLERAPKRLAAELGFVLAEDRVVLREGERTIVATGMRRGHEITMEIELGEELVTRLLFEGGGLVLAGIECDAETASRELDAALDAAPPRQGGYR